ncbi:hypothetical protein [Flammeovirga pacifica]|uniref:Lipoprotein n=1 Tax=Flammeovirga pacifica TaxID=915059 RepID=A0A1S1Z2T8_FLAPC|nr:hypothetical protein [Flammeovirga pacifica]OHX67589.1 hypothetical protein NH26_15145 [Flammeovirga pacifica]
MKNSIKFIAPLAILLSLASCNKDKDPEPVAQTPKVETPTAAVVDSTETQNPDQVAKPETQDKEEITSTSSTDTKSPEEGSSKVTDKLSSKFNKTNKNEDELWKSKKEKGLQSLPIKDKGIVKENSKSVVETTTAVSIKEQTAADVTSDGKKLDNFWLKGEAQYHMDEKRPYDQEIPSNLIGQTFKFGYQHTFADEYVECKITFTGANRADLVESANASAEYMYVRYDKRDETINYRIGEEDFSIPMKDLRLVK